MAGISRKQVWMIVAGAVLVSAFGWLLIGGLDKNVVFFF